MFEMPPVELLPALSAAPGIKVEVFDKFGAVGCCRLNHLVAPFNNLAARRAAQLAINQEDIKREAIGNPAYYQTCGSHFTCGSPVGMGDGSEVLMFKAPVA
jgi:peptide/nickel transport system substrate-binding protein